MANVMRYSYLRGPGGRFRNPYDHGIRKNCSDFLINGYNEDVECTEEPSLPEGVGTMEMARISNLSNGENHFHHTNGNSDVSVNADSKSSKHHHGHVHSSQCNHNNHGKGNGAPLGLGLGLGRNNARSVVAS